ncbi:Tetratricopeptide repeat-containing protein [Nitrosospira sp. Nl5]|uniref:tetratricopeptide repeat protein n=1 Tax=Nitrosospira sp. Nl5 TaxID=200120 RepID=UPI0008852E39|nr:tetratricopeptide repeat protein [Nitrosospira sp. Nl5]SCY28731.1 Tetratricopeptide repeat-containing protein [Nitrosospira sp. Nl5]
MKKALLLAIALIIPAFGVMAHAPAHPPGGTASPQEVKLGKVNFPTSAESEKAQVLFLRGVAALHSFSYELALDAFRQAMETEPDFVMAHWGEAMAYNQTLWGQQDTEAARKVLASIKDTPRLTSKERAYLHAVKILYGEGDKTARDKAYAEAMEKVYREYPDDLEAASFFVLALLGSVRSEDPAGIRNRVKAGAIALEVARKQPDHPGATHYILHTFDDPVHAILALPAAQRYADIAPDAPHAGHMPSHVFLQLGMWPEAAATLEASWARQKDSPVSERDYHSLYWLHYVYLQQGRYGKAEELLALMQKGLADSPEEARAFRGYATFIYSAMAAAFIVETRRWDWAAKLIDSLQRNTAHFIDAVERNPGPYQGLAKYVQSLWIFTRGMAAAHKNLPDAQKSIDALQAMAQGTGPGTGDLPGIGLPLSKILEIQRLEVGAVASASKGKLDEAIRSMKKATAAEEPLPPLPGPPPLIKPSHELFGEILLQAGRPAEAEKQFETALLRHTNRASSLLGAARAAARQGNRESAITAYSLFLRQWRLSDAGLPELQEARDYLKQANAY